jgi:hypothetical protein
MATHDYIIGNQGFPAFRSDLNDVLAAIVSNNSSATEPATKYAYMMWYDSTTNIWKMRNAANDAWISLATFDQATNTVNFLDSSVSILGLATSATGTVLTLTDTHLNSTVSIRLPDATSIQDDSGNEYIKFLKTASAINEISVTNSDTGNNPEISATGDDTNIDLKLTPKGSGNLVLDGIKFPNADGTANQVLQTDGSGNLSFANTSGGIAWQSSIVTGATLSAVSGNGYWINTTSNACTITLPASATVGDTIVFVDYARTWGTNAVTINQNSLNFQGGTSPNPVYDTEGQSVTIVYSGATQGWIPTVDDAVTDETPPPYSADFLVIAGGGGGGIGGGGSGGYRNSYSTEASGGGGSSESSLTFSVGTVYTITVGAGGPGQANSGVVGTNGVDSSISGTGITTITSTGGGGGGGNLNPSSIDGIAGGSGGGGGAFVGGSNFTGGSGTANQGYAGGIGRITDSPAAAAGGGGGASAVGGNGTSSPTVETGGVGGNGLASSITGSSVTRGGGGGGGSGNPQTASSAGGSGGGGQGAGANNTANVAGTVNTGGGGGGSGGTFNVSRAGGSGVVILRMPTANYSGIVTGAETPIVDGSDTILIFNASGSYTG